MRQWRKSEPTAWQRALAARARGEVPDAEDLAEAQERAKPPGEPAWVKVVAAKIAGGALAEVEEEPRELSEMERRLRRRLGVPVDDGTDDAA